MVENLSAQAVIKDKLSHAANSLVNKVEHGIQSLAKSKPSDHAPTPYKITHKGGALVREGYETTSAQVHQLAAGEVVMCVDLVGRRARIISPVQGWVSTETRDGVQIMRPTGGLNMLKTGKDEAFESMFEQKFNRLKAQSGKSGGGMDPRDPRAQQKSRTPSRSPSPKDRDRNRGRGRDRDRSDDDDDQRDRARGARGSGAAASSRQAPQAPQEKFVPKLSAPGSKGGPAVLAPPPGSGRTTALAAAAPAPAASGGGGDLFDLLGDDDAKPAAAPAAATGGLDLFGDAPAAPAAVPAFGGAQAAAPAPAQDLFGPSAGEAGAWASFQGSEPGGASAAGAAPDPFNPFSSAPASQTPAAATGYAALGPAGMALMQGAGGGVAGMTAMGWGMGQVPGGMGGAPAAPAMGGYAGPAAQPPGAPGWGAFGSGAAPARPPMPAATQAPAPAGGFTFGAPAAGGSQVDDLMAKTMGGLSNLSVSPAAPKQQQGMSMNLLG